MDHGLLKHWPIICLVAAAGISAVVMKLAMGTSTGVITAEDQSYEMLRPKSSTPGYDLSGRRVVREIHSVGGNATGGVAPSHPQLMASPVAPATPATSAATGPMNAHQSAAAKAQAEANARKAKSLADKEKAREQAKVQAQKKAAEALAATEARKKAEAQYKDDSSPAKKANPDDNNQQTQVAANNGYSDPAPAAPDSPTASDDKSKMSPAQWRSLMHGQPTQRNAAAFLSAFHSGDVDSGTFYQVAQELLTDSATDRQDAGIYLLKQESSVKTFTVLVANYKDQTPEPLKSKVYEVIKSYGDASKFSVLNKVLLASDSRSTQMATDILSQVVATQNTVKTEASGRDSRSPGSTPISASSFQAFIPTLKRLASSPDASIASKAQSLLESIQAMKPV